MNSAFRPTIYPNGANTPTNLDLQIRSKGTGVLQLNNDNNGNVVIATGGGNVGIGTTSPNPNAPNGTKVGNLDANDVYLRGASKWASQSGGLIYHACTDLNINYAYGGAATYCGKPYGNSCVLCGTNITVIPRFSVPPKILSGSYNFTAKPINVATGANVIYLLFQFKRMPKTFFFPA